MFKKLACFTGWLLVLSLSLLFCFTLGLWQNWSTPAILTFWLLKLVLSTLLRGGMHAITRVIKTQRGSRWLEKYRLSRREYVLLNHWRHGANVIRRLHLQRTPLPWYLLMGDRCGKSTLLAGTGLPRFDGDSDVTAAGPTRTLHWWFFRRIGVLELSGNFLNGTTTFRRAWNRLTHWCTRMPAPAGIVVTLPVSALTGDDLSTLHTLARRLRSLAAPLVRRFGERLPLYVLITQCDLFPGFSLWHQQLSPTQRQHPLGYSWPSPPHIDGEDELTLQPLFEHLKQGMSRTRLSMSRPVSLSAEENASLMDFPESFASLEPGLRYALASLCEPNAYFSPVHLNSVWFCASEPRTENTGQRDSLFTHDLLAGHLHELSLRCGARRWYQRTRGRLVCTTVLIACLLWLGVSAGLSYCRLQPLLTQLPPNALASFLVQDERYPVFALRYLPFTPLFTRQHQQAEVRLAQFPSAPRQAQATFATFQQQVLAAPPARQRGLILNWPSRYSPGSKCVTTQHLTPLA